MYRVNHCDHCPSVHGPPSTLHTLESSAVGPDQISYPAWGSHTNKPLDQLPASSCMGQPQAWGKGVLLASRGPIPHAVSGRDFPKVTKNPNVSFECFYHTPWTLCYLFLKYFIYILFLERGEGREKERETNIDSVVSHIHPNWGLNLWPRPVSWPGIELVTFHFAG